MISVDIHTHTSYGHGSSTVLEMFMAGQSKGLTVHGFSEHSPRPLGYDYTNEYRDHLAKFFPQYLHEVKELQKNQDTTKVLLGLELDWFEKELDLMHHYAEQENYDYIIAGIHFLDKWGFDDQASHWTVLRQQEKERFYIAYYKTMIEMAKTKLFHVLAHPDLIKIFSVDDFHAWLPKNLNLVEEALIACKEANMVMEISTAGLRKPCAEMYPCRSIMEIAQKNSIGISFASDGHCVNTIAHKFDELALYAKEYGYSESTYFVNKQAVTQLF